MANQNYTTPFIIVADPAEHLFDQGAEFDRQEMNWTLWTASWPDGLVVRDAADDWRYEVRKYRPRGGHEHQRLESLCGTRWLVPQTNGTLKTVTP